MKRRVLLVGAGPMAIEYAKVLDALGVDYDVFGRGEKSANCFEKKTGKIVVRHGIDELPQNKPITIYEAVIIAVSENMLGEVTRKVIKAGSKKILVEKPGGLTSEDVFMVKEYAEKYNARVYVGYNRRFYASVKRAAEIIISDGGVSSFNFEFTEWSHQIEPLKKDIGVKKQWFLANSSHVIDLAFFLGGIPDEITSYCTGGLPWHPNASIFTGAGISKKGALFSYNANWEAPGRWGVEILTKKHRLYLRPLEKLQIQNIGEIQIKDVCINDEIDITYKPGLYRQVEEFLFGKCKNIITIDEQCNNLIIYNKMGAHH